MNLLKINSAALLSTLACSALIYLIQGFGLAALKPLQLVLGVYFLFFPMGFIFVSAILPRNEITAVSRLALAVASSISINSLAVYALNYAFSVPINYLANIAVLQLLSITFFLLYLLEARFKCLK